MRRLFLIPILCLMVLSSGVYAQDAPRLATLEVSLWPEFDRPEALVIYRGLLAPEVSLPAPLEIRIPASAGEPTAVAYVGEDGQRYKQQYTTRQEGDWTVVAFTLESQGFQLEYYDAMTTGEEGQRTYTLNLVMDYDVADLNLDFQVPPTAQDFALDPPADSVTQEGDGLTYHAVHQSSIAQGERLSWTITYQKDNEDLTVALFTQPQTPTPAPAQVPTVGGSQAGGPAWVWLVALVAVVAVGAGAFWLGRRTCAEPPPPPPKKRRGRRKSSAPPPARSLPPAPPSGALFCHQCGTQLRPDASFCHQCGTVVRSI